jgi:hypothetical protein
MIVRKDMRRKEGGKRGGARNKERRGEEIEDFLTTFP